MKKKMERCRKCGAERLVNIKYPELTPCLNCVEKARDKIKKAIRKGRR